MKNELQNMDDQHWDVFRYVAEEMTPEEESSFEQRLADDQSLREQVGKMTITLASVESAFASAKFKPVVAKRDSRLHFKRMFVSAAAMVAIAALAIGLTMQPAETEPSEESIAIAWAESVEFDEFELVEEVDENEFAPVEFAADDEDWVASVVAAVDEETGILN
jgi:anti-sigma-K factor RskA